MGFIRTPDPVATKDLEIAELKAELSKYKNKARQAEAVAIRAMSVVQDIEDDCPECENLCALEQEVCDSSMDVAKIQSKITGDLCNIWAPKLKCNGMGAELTLMGEILDGLMAESEYKLAVAAHNYAYCKGLNAGAYIDEKKAELTALVDANPDIDKRCLGYINELMLLACA